MLAKIIALDIGEKRIGVAVSDGLGMLAHPLQTIIWKGYHRFITELKSIIAEQEAVTLVVGMPFTLKGTSSKKTEEIQELAARIRSDLKIDVVEEDERLTTKMAENALHAVGKKPSRQRDKIDQIAAVYILQSYLDRTHRLKE